MPFPVQWIPFSQYKKGESQFPFYALRTLYSWFATTWQGGHVGGQNKRIFPWRIYMKIEFSSQRREMLLFLTTDMAAVTSRANQQFLKIFQKGAQFCQNSLKCRLWNSFRSATGRRSNCGHFQQCSEVFVKSSEMLRIRIRLWCGENLTHLTQKKLAGICHSQTKFNLI